MQFSTVNFVDDICHNLKRSIEYRAWGGGSVREVFAEWRKDLSVHPRGRCKSQAWWHVSTTSELQSQRQADPWSSLFSHARQTCELQAQ